MLVFWYVGGSLVILGETLGFWLRLICIINLREKCGIGFNSRSLGNYEINDIIG